MRERYRRLRPRAPHKTGEFIMAGVLLLSTGIFAEYQFQVVKKVGDSAGAVAELIDASTYALRKSISSGAHGVGNWADPGPAR